MNSHKNAIETRKGNKKGVDNREKGALSLLIRTVKLNLIQIRINELFLNVLRSIGIDSLVYNLQHKQTKLCDIFNESATLALALSLDQRNSSRTLKD